MAWPRIFAQQRVQVWTCAVALLAALAGFCQRAADDTSAAYDEPGHMLAGFSYWSDQGPAIATANLRVAQLWLALPLLPLDLHYPEAGRRGTQLATGVGAGELGRAFVHDRRHDPGRLLRASRAAVTVLGLALGLVIFLWARRVAGDAAGLLALGLYCFEPLIIAHSALATTDIAATLLFTLALAAWWRLLHRVSVMTVGWAGLATGLLVTAKLSAVLLGPAVLLLMVVRLARGGEAVVAGPGSARTVRGAAMLGPWALAVGVVGVVAYGMIWAIYGFHFAPGALLPDEKWYDVLQPDAGWALRTVNFCRVHRLLPEAYLFDVQWFVTSTGGRRAFLLGDYSVEGFAAYFPIAWLTKTSPALLLALGVVAVAAGLAWVRRGAGAATVRLGDFWPLGVFAVIYGGVAVAGSLNIGLRHLLPVYPALFVAAGASVTLWTAGRWRLGYVGVMTAAALVVAKGASPWFLAYFNPAAGGMINGHRVLLESNYDWGQDLPRVSRWVAAYAAAGGVAERRVYFAYYGTGDIARYNIEARLLPQEPEYRPTTVYELLPGCYVISATLLQSLGGNVVWGPWRPTLEHHYRTLRRELAPLYAIARARGTGPTAVTPLEEQQIRLYDELRFVRLCAYLRHRQPRSRITPGVFAFEVTAEDLTAALDGPPPIVPPATIRGLERLPHAWTNFLR
jgi:4-amino-4-deoxy-L-arabinose transferase-like glycosyltransferase